ncbi:MAG TPA: hypothetical protein VGL91_01320 [Acidobacteriota bacterium]
MKSKPETLSYRGHVARFTAAPMVNKGFYFCQALVYQPGHEDRGEVIAGRGASPAEARQDCVFRVKAKVDGWLG